MSPEPFRFKQFTVHQDRCTMKVGTDGVLLGAWADVRDANPILDIGSGTGLVALMAAQRNPTARIDAVEMDHASCQQANRNISISKWGHRIKMYNVSIQNFKAGHKYECIICNPPFFRNGNHTRESQRDKARNSNHLPALDLIHAANRLLTRPGLFNMIYPYTESVSFIKLAKERGLNLRKKTVVRSRHELPPERILMQFTNDETTLSENELIIFKSGSGKSTYTLDYITLTKDFYLYM